MSPVIITSRHHSQSFWPLTLLRLQVVSPFQAILDYERANNIPIGWVNHAISRSHPNGAWQRIERGEIPLDDAFFLLFKSDLENEAVWKPYCHQHGLGGRPPPQIEAKALFWEMMRTSRAPDPHMYPALLKLRESGKFIIGALSNTISFPTGIVDDKGVAFDSSLQSTGGRRTSLPHMNGTIASAFDIFISSAHVGIRKPDAKIYALAIEELDLAARKKGLGEGLKAQDILFLDDIGQNLKAAKELGMMTLKVELGQTARAVAHLQQLTGVALTAQPPPKASL